MELKEKILSKKIFEEKIDIKDFKTSYNSQAAITHYYHNQNNNESNYFKKTAIHQIKDFLKYKYPDNDINDEVAEEAIKYIFSYLRENIPFPQPNRPKFKFIELFDSVDGFKNLNAKYWR